MHGFFDTPIEFLKGVGPQKAALFNKELKIFTYGDLIQYYPYRYEDRTRFYAVRDIDASMPYIQLKGKIRHMETVGPPRKRRLVVYFKDDTGEIELVWFKGVDWVMKKLQPGVEYVVFGRPSAFGRKINMAHPEIEVLTNFNIQGGYLQPVYSTTELLKRKYLDSKAIGKLMKTLSDMAKPKVSETLPSTVLDDYRLVGKEEAIRQIHFPEDNDALQKARFRLKFEELFYVQLRLLKLKIARMDKFRGMVFDKADLLSKFYNHHLPFELTNAQKRVIKEIYRDMRSAKQMNRLLQGDVGSGKTIVGFICMLLAVDAGTQAALMAPTEILAIQHYHGLKEHADKMGLRIALLTGSTKTSERKIIHQYLKSGELHILVGTHALIEEKVQFQILGLALIDEQHRFGVAQRSKLWQKNKEVYPHVLVMTATPIPRTLAMTLYGDLDVSTIDELPAGRKPIQTVHRYDSNRLKVNGFIKEQVDLGRQVYVVYPLIEESEKLDLKHLEDGYESICRAFPGLPVSIVHGKMKSEAKDFEMNRFAKGETKIMVATTVIEVGVNVPNATVMVIENAERFGLAQLHQLRGRVGRGADQSYCILMTSFKLSKEGKVRIETMVRTNNGFEIADTDLKLRGPGDLTGTQQSGVLDLLIADLGKDGNILQEARIAAQAILAKDPDLSLPENFNVKKQVEAQKKTVVNWSRIS
ncbi:ATP-dependent DNA helicase RecG [Fulvivirga sp. M361]|uniref:ATP-dependent DNA helicase RecG n=1 Tax=Fulvivirga sp. M361 TaxID=2594266 RepID=UPI001179BFE8|nr:ATP-dependent DNA helicase RecG [Fulvivirga sp. M361]TRX58391.1 ATP-dependent DNA helicase RecG [Fulvivirga sp. M361]